MTHQAEEKYLVPFDFGDISKNALNFALENVRTIGGTVVLLHIVDNKPEIAGAKRELDKVINELPEGLRHKVSCKVMEGEIIEDIGKTAELLDVSVIIMGTRGVKGLQRLFGGKAFKIISNSTLPFIILKSDHKLQDIKKIVMPFSYAKESIQIARFASSIAKKYKAVIHLAGYKDSDEWLAKGARINEIVVARHLKEEGVDFELVNLPGDSTYEDELLNYASEINADLIAAAFFDTGLLELDTPFLTEMLENDKGISVLTVNAKDLFLVRAKYTFITV